MDDYWVISELSNLLKRSGENGLPDDVFITPAGGAPEAAYVATLMIGQKLDVVVLLDSDPAGKAARDKLIKNWLDRYQDSHAEVLHLGDAVGADEGEFAIEDMFTSDLYAELIEEAYKKDLRAHGIEKVKFVGNDSLCKRAARFLEDKGIKFTKGRVARLMRSRLSAMKDASELPKEMRKRAKKMFEAIREALPKEEQLAGVDN